MYVWFKKCSGVDFHFISSFILKMSISTMLFTRFRLFPNELSPHISEYHPLRLHTKNFMSSFFLRLPALTSTLHPCHLYISTGWHPIIHTIYAPYAQTTSATPHHVHLPHSIYRLYKLRSLKISEGHFIPKWKRHQWRQVEFTCGCCTSPNHWKQT